MTVITAFYRTVGREADVIELNFIDAARLQLLRQRNVVVPHLFVVRVNPEFPLNPPLFAGLFVDLFEFLSPRLIVAAVPNSETVVSVTVELRILENDNPGNDVEIPAAGGFNQFFQPVTGIKRAGCLRKFERGIVNDQSLIVFGVNDKGIEIFCGKSRQMRLKAGAGSVVGVDINTGFTGGFAQPLLLHGIFRRNKPGQFVNPLNPPPLRRVVKADVFPRINFQNRRIVGLNPQTDNFLGKRSGNFCQAGGKPIDFVNSVSVPSRNVKNARPGTVTESRNLFVKIGAAVKSAVKPVQILIE